MAPSWTSWRRSWTGRLMSDPRAVTPEFAAWPPIGWGCTITPWEKRLDEWRKRPRKERIKYPGERLRRDIRPVPIGRRLVWSPGGCATFEIEQRIALGWAPRKLLARGFWLVDGTSTERIKNIDAWFDQREEETRAQARAGLKTLAMLRAKSMEAAGAIDRLALLLEDES